MPSSTSQKLLQVPPYDFMQVDDVLSEEALSESLKNSHQWMAEGCLPLMPRSCCVLESIRMEDAPAYGPYFSVLGPISLSERPQKKVREPPRH